MMRGGLGIRFRSKPRLRTGGSGLGVVQICNVVSRACGEAQQRGASCSREVLGLPPLLRTVQSSWIHTSKPHLPKRNLSGCLKHMCISFGRETLKREDDTGCRPYDDWPFAEGNGGVTGRIDQRHSKN